MIEYLFAADRLTPLSSLTKGVLSCKEDWFLSVAEIGEYKVCRDNAFLFSLSVVKHFSIPKEM